MLFLSILFAAFEILDFLMQTVRCKIFFTSSIEIFTLQCLGPCNIILAAQLFNASIGM